MSKPAKVSLLDHFYDHLSEDDWLKGVDLYQAGRVSALATYEGLITARIVPALEAGAEVRLKIHPAGHCIQWIECTCRQNRTLGQYCAHIAALMLHIDRERSELFSGLDSTMPLKPPMAVKKRAPATPLLASPESETATRGHSATQTIIDHLKGNIHSIGLLAKGPGLRVRIEIKPGHLTHYDLSIDASAKFLASHLHSEVATADVKVLEIFTTPVELASRIFQPDPEKVIAERVVVVPRPHKLKQLDLQSLKMGSFIGQYKRVAADDQEGREDTFLFIPLKGAARYLGQEYFFLPGYGYFPVDKQLVNSQWTELPLARTFKDDEAAQFCRDGFRSYSGASPLYLDESLKDPVILEAPQLSEIEILSQEDGWFRLDPRYGKGKSMVSMVELMKQYRKKKRQFVRSGKFWLKIPDFITEHDWQLDESGEALKVDALGLLRLKAAVGEFDQFVGSKKALQQIKASLEFSPESAVPVPHDTKIKLRHYQEVGLSWMWWLYRHGLHGLLADEMGLGKTHQAMALLTAILQEKPDAKFLIICPTTVLDHWLDKIEQFAPDLKPIRFHGPKRTYMLRDLEHTHSTLLTSYGITLRDIRHLAPIKWEAVILDEAHIVKNNDTATYQAACRLQSKIRICLTGTPMENHLGELKNLFDFLVPGFLGSDDYFKRHFLAPITSDREPQTELALQKLIHPFKMRRTKEQVLPDLPAKVEDLRHCQLSDTQTALYREVLAMKAAPLVQKMQDDETPIPYLHVFATLTMLKQICNHPALLDDKPNYRAHESGKFELLKELLDEAIGSGHKIVIFSQYVGMINLITSYLNDQKIQHVQLTGQSKNRGELIREFQTKPDIKVFCGSLLAGGIGIDLTAASVVIHYDRWWNASKENQATDRVHRIGQNKNVQVLKLVTRGTLEEKIDRMIAAKRELFEKFLDRDEDIFKTLSRQELIDLLQ